MSEPPDFPPPSPEQAVGQPYAGQPYAYAWQQVPWGQPSQAGAWRAPARTPPTVVAAAVVTYVCSGLMAGMTLVVALGALLVGGMLADYLDWSDAAGLGLILLGWVVASLTMSILACWAAWQTTRRRGWARIVLTVLAGLALSASLVMLGPHTVIVLPGTVAVIVLLFVPASNDWFRES